MNAALKEVAKEMNDGVALTEDQYGIWLAMVDDNVIDILTTAILTVVRFYVDRLETVLKPTTIEFLKPGAEPTTKGFFSDLVTNQLGFTSDTGGFFASGGKVDQVHKDVIVTHSDGSETVIPRELIEYESQPPKRNSYVGLNSPLHPLTGEPIVRPGWKWVSKPRLFIYAGKQYETSIGYWAKET